MRRCVGVTMRKHSPVASILVRAPFGPVMIDAVPVRASVTPRTESITLAPDSTFHAATRLRVAPLPQSIDRDAAYLNRRDFGTEKIGTDYCGLCVMNRARTTMLRVAAFGESTMTRNPLLAVRIGNVRRAGSSPGVLVENVSSVPNRSACSVVS
jgi:hypothetical protein